MEDLNKFLKEWSAKKTIDGKSVDEGFQIEGIPLWWFYRRLFVPHVLPKQLNTFASMERKKPLEPWERLRLTLAAAAMKKIFLFREKRKIAHFSRKTQFTPQNKVLFLSYSNHLSSDGEIFRIQQMIDKMQQDGKIKPLVIFADPFTSKNYKILDGKDSLYQYYDDELAAKAALMARELSGKWQSITEEDKIKLLQTADVSLWVYLKYAFSFFWSQEFMYVAALYYEICKKIIREERIQALVLTSQSGLLEKCFLAAAQNMKIPVVQIQHGISSGILDTTFSPKRLVFSDFHKRELIEAGVAASDIIVTGPIVFDDVFKYKRTSARSKPASMTEVKALIATSSFVEFQMLQKEVYYQRIEAILKSLYNQGIREVIIKLHPREKQDANYLNLLNKFNFSSARVIKNCTRKEFYRLMARSDVFIHFGSTAGFEALLLDAAVITICLAESKESLFKQEYCRLMFDEDAGQVISYHDDLRQALEFSLQHQDELRIKRKRFVRKYCYKGDGKAHERAVTYIYSLLFSSQEERKEQEGAQEGMNSGK